MKNPVDREKEKKTNLFKKKWECEIIPLRLATYRGLVSTVSHTQQQHARNYYDPDGDTVRKTRTTVSSK